MLVIYLLCIYYQKLGKYEAYLQQSYVKFCQYSIL